MFFNHKASAHSMLPQSQMTCVHSNSRIILHRGATHSQAEYLKKVCKRPPKAMFLTSSGIPYSQPKKRFAFQKSTEDSRMLHIIESRKSRSITELHGEESCQRCSSPHVISANASEAVCKTVRSSICHNGAVSSIHSCQASCL